MKESTVSDDDFKQAMACFPSGVTIVTTVDEDDQKFGFTASAFLSLSLTPPLILVCLATEADCFSSFNRCKHFAVNIIGAEHEELAFKFATKGADKFGGNEFVKGKNGLPILPGCPVSLECEAKYNFPGGDHIILVGEVLSIELNSEAATIWHIGKFRHLNSST